MAEFLRIPDDAGKSPTSPLDFGGLFSPTSSSSSPRNKWLSDKVGLSVLSSSIGHTRDYIVLSPQIKPNLDNTTTPIIPQNYATAVTIRSSSSSPVNIISTQVYSRSLSGREMALSEDYTCIISHGPNPKTTHIFGDCILDCDPKGLDIKEEVEIPQPVSVSLPHDSFTRLCLCTGTPLDSHIDRKGN